MISKRSISVAAATLACLALAACKASGEDPQGAVITALKGDVSVTTSKGEKRKLSSAGLYSKDALLLTGYSMTTGKDARVDLRFTSGIQMRVGPSTSIKIGAARILTGENFSQVMVNLNKGKLYSRVDKLAKGSRLTVVTPTAIASVRGTDFLVIEENGKSTTMVNGGAVSVSDEKVNGSKIVEPGKKGVVAPSGDIVVADLTDDDRKELNDFGGDIAPISEQGRAQIQNIMQTFQEQKQLIKQALEEQKRINEDILQQQKDKNKGTIEEQRERDRELLRKQIEKDRQNYDKVISDTRRAADEIKSKADSEKGNIRSGGKTQADKIKSNTQADDIKNKTKNKGLDDTRKQLDKFKKLQ